MNESESNKVFLYRIKYNAGLQPSALDNYHYYNAYTSDEALNFHIEVSNKHERKMQTLSIEKYDHYARKWRDESECLNANASSTNNT